MRAARVKRRSRKEKGEGGHGPSPIDSTPLEGGRRPRRGTGKTIVGVHARATVDSGKSMTADVPSIVESRGRRWYDDTRERHRLATRDTDISPTHRASSRNRAFTLLYLPVVIPSKKSFDSSFEDRRRSRQFPNTRTGPDIPIAARIVTSIPSKDRGSRLSGV